MDSKTALAELASATFAAFDYGHQGRVARGYLILTTGLMEARRAAGGEGEPMTALWEQVMAQFRERFPNEGYLDCQ